MPAARPIDETVLAITARPVAYVSAITLASLLDSSETTVWEWQRKGILPRAVIVGGATR